MRNDARIKSVKLNNYENTVVIIQEKCQTNTRLM